MIQNIIFKLLLIVLVSVFGVANTLDLSEKEKKYLQNHPIIKVGYSTAFEPLLFQDNTGKLQGIIPDAYKLVEKKFGLKFSFEIDNWKTVFEKLSKGEIDVIPYMATRTAKQRGFLTAEAFSGNLLNIFTKNDFKKIHSFDDLKGYKIAYNKDVLIFGKHLEQYKNIEIIPANNTLDAFIKLERGEVDSVLSFQRDRYILDKNELVNILPNYVIREFKVYTTTAIKPDDQILQSIMNKAMLSLDSKDIQVINEKWIGKQEEFIEEKSYKYYVIAGGVVLLLILFLYIDSQRRIKQLEKEKELLDKMIRESTDKDDTKDLVFKSTFKKYNYSLLALLVIAVLSYFSFAYYLQSKNDYGELINKSGKQRMLSQRLIVEANDYLLSNGISKNEYIKFQELFKTDHEWIMNHLRGIEKTFYETNKVDQEFKRYLALHKQMVQMPTKEFYIKISQEGKNSYHF